jgi:hypothetical protein
MGAHAARGTVAAALFLVFGVAFAAPAQAQQVGQATNVRVVAVQTPPGSRAFEVMRYAPIFRGAVLSTSPRGALEVTFSDGSRVAMGGGSSVVVDAYVYSGPGGAGQQTVRYSKGLFRFISGNIPKDRVRLETPTTVIGIRGTTVRTNVEEDGTTTVGVDDGIVLVTSKQTGQSVTLNPGEKVTIKPAGTFGQVQLGRVEGCN